MGLLGKILGLGSTVVEKLLPNLEKRQEKHLEIHAEGERSGQGRMTPYKAFGYLLVVLLAWEFVRSFVVHYWPGANVPPSMLNEIMSMAATYFGLGL